jgi:DNA-binding MarR family transcriptional regulator
MPYLKRVSDEEILEAMLDLEKESPHGTVTLSELARKLGITKQALSQRLDDRKRDRGLVQRGLVARVGRRFKLTDAGRGVAEAYRRMKEEVKSGYAKKVAKFIYELYLSDIVNVPEVREEERLPLCYSLLSKFLIVFLTELRLITPKVANEREFERELKKLWEKQSKYSEATLKEIAKVTIEALAFACGKYIREIFNTYLYTLLGIGFFNLAVEKATLASLKFEGSRK